MSKDAVATMGTILTDDVGGRDAVHVAVISATAIVALKPGQHVSLQGEPDETLLVGPGKDHIGIVDPFLTVNIKAGERFWLYLYPRTITSLRHNWTHPKFADAPIGSVYTPPATRLASEQWLRDFCANADCPSYETVIKAIEGSTFLDAEPNDRIYVDGDCIHVNGTTAHGEIPPEFWDHVETVLGKKVKKKPTYFSCSC